MKKPLTIFYKLFLKIQKDYSNEIFLLLKRCKDHKNRIKILSMNSIHIIVKW